MRNGDTLACKRGFRIIGGLLQTFWPQCGCGFDIRPERRKKGGEKKPIISKAKIIC